LHRILPVVLIVLTSACGDRSAPAEADEAAAGSGGDETRAEVERVLDAAFVRIAQLTDSIDDILQPVPLLTPAQESALRQFGNAAQLARARSLGVRPADSVELAAVRQDGRLVALADSTELWAVRELDHSVALVTPAAHALLTRIGERFQQRLAEMGLPRYRVEVTSVLRTAETQADLRQTNLNAAAGMSTHEFGTTLDIAYSSFAPPYDPDVAFDAGSADWLESRLDWVASRSLEAAAARKSRELQAILGAVLLDMQQAGDVMVTLERQQPVYHLTVARRLDG
jgi:hypothetical protein